LELLDNKDKKRLLQQLIFYGIIGKTQNMSQKFWKISEKYLSLQQIIKAPPFFLEWTWPSEDGFFSILTLALWHNA